EENQDATIETRSVARTRMNPLSECPFDRSSRSIFFVRLAFFKVTSPTIVPGAASMAADHVEPVPGTLRSRALIALRHSRSHGSPDRSAPCAEPNRRTSIAAAPVRLSMTGQDHAGSSGFMRGRYSSYGVMAPRQRRDEFLITQGLGRLPAVGPTAVFRRSTDDERLMSRAPEDLV